MKRIFFYLSIALALSCNDEDQLDSTILGCMDQDACNYSPSANKDDESCIYYDAETQSCSSDCTLLDEWAMFITTELVPPTNCIDDHCGFECRGFGLASEATDGFDSCSNTDPAPCDLAEPPAVPGGCTRLYFIEAWEETIANRFITDYKLNGIYPNYSNKISWNATIQNLKPDNSKARLIFDYLPFDDASQEYSQTDPMTAYVEVVVDEDSYFFIDGVDFIFSIAAGESKAVRINVWNACKPVTDENF